MRKKRSIIVLVLICITLLFISGCGQNEPPVADDQASAISFTDMTGREVILDAPAQRIVVLTAADCEIIFALGAGDTVVGRGEYCDWPSEALAKESVKSGSETNIEQLINLSPDVVIMNTMDQTQEQVQALEAAGITVVCSNANNIDDTYLSIEMLGKLTGKNKEAKLLVQNMQDTFSTVSAKAADAGKKQTVYFEVSPLEYGLWAAGAGTFMDEIASMLGLENIFADVEGWVQISEEQVIQRDPDIIVSLAMSFPGSEDPIDEIMSRPGWQELAAVKNSMIINLPDDELTRPGPRLAEGAVKLCDFIYGEEN